MAGRRLRGDGRRDGIAAAVFAAQLDRCTSLPCHAVHAVNGLPEVPQLGETLPLRHGVRCCAAICAHSWLPGLRGLHGLQCKKHPSRVPHQDWASLMCRRLPRSPGPSASISCRRRRGQVLPRQHSCSHHDSGTRSGSRPMPGRATPTGLPVAKGMRVKRGGAPSHICDSGRGAPAQRVPFGKRAVDCPAANRGARACKWRSASCAQRARRATLGLGRASSRPPQ